MVFGHLPFSDVADWITGRLSREIFNGAITIFWCFSLAAFGLVLLRAVQGRPDREGGLLYAGTAVLLAAVSYNALFVTNVESVHFVQYALLALPLYALTHSFGRTVLYVTLLGALDEAYQYFVLYGDLKTVYFDFNDVILNLAGGALGVVAIFLLADLPRPPRLAAGGGRRIVGAMILSAVAAVLLASCGLIRAYPGPDGGSGALLLSRAPAPEHFWVELPWGKTYHVLHPLEGLALAGLLLLFFSRMDRSAAKGER
ncbi:VanZ family protein [uncultured Desulfuromonas sp.]|uniref:VanZ family protein n=1 Tax=uncultured Desulfuromonas sp. TaxID=181013 RepID=UPI00261163BF|nr:VanZ family protein [uncultured Desulfuromonas sp.]